MKIEDLKQPATERKTQRYPEAFQRDAVEVVCRPRDEGWTQKDVSDLLKVPWVTLVCWKDSGNEALSEPIIYLPIIRRRPNPKTLL